MREGWEQVGLDTLISPVRRLAQIDPSADYKQVTLAVNGKGARLRKIVKGAELGTARFEVRAGDLMISKIDARKGAASLLPDELDGAIVTGDFLSYRVNEERLLPALADLYVRDKRFASAADAISGGTTNRVRFDPSRLHAIAFLLPALPEQRRIVDLIGAIDDAIEKAEASAGAVGEAERRLRDDLFRRLEAERVPAGSKFEMTLGRQKTGTGIEGKRDIPYLRAANIGDSVLNLADVNMMGFAPSDIDAFSLRRGDIVLVEGGSVGLAAMWNEEIEGPVGFDKHVIRIRPRSGKSTSDFALHWTKWSRSSGAFDAQATGVTIKALGFARASAMPVPDISIDDQRVLLAPVVALASTGHRLARQLASLRALREKMLTALLSGDHAIPESYDALVEVAA